MVNANAKQVIREQASRLHSESHVGFSSPVVHELVLFAEQREFSIFFPPFEVLPFFHNAFPFASSYAIGFDLASGNTAL